MKRNIDSTILNDDDLPKSNIYTLQNIQQDNRRITDGTRYDRLIVATSKDVSILESNEGDYSLKSLKLIGIPDDVEIISSSSFIPSLQTNSVESISPVLGLVYYIPSLKTFSINLYQTLSYFLINQKCEYQTYEIDFIPFQISFCKSWSSTTKEEFEGFLVTGSPNMIKGYRFQYVVKQDARFEELSKEQLIDFFPEFSSLSHSIISMKSFNFQQCRILVYGTTTGFFQVSCYDSKMVSYSDTLNGSCIVHVNLCNPQWNEIKNDIDMVITSSNGCFMYYSHVLSNGLQEVKILVNDCKHGNIFSSILGDFELNGSKEILCSTKDNMILGYELKEDGKDFKKCYERKCWSSFMCLSFCDINGDGIKELIGVSMDGLHIFEPDKKILLHKFNEKIEQLIKQEL